VPVVRRAVCAWRQRTPEAVLTARRSFDYLNGYPKWVHGKRAVAEADRLLSAAELEARVYAYYGCECEAHLVMLKKVT